jgi:hypothetical protein
MKLPKKTKARRRRTASAGGAFAAGGAQYTVRNVSPKVDEVLREMAVDAHRGPGWIKR